MKNKIVFETQRLIIRYFKISDLDTFYDIMGNPKVMNPIPAKVLNKAESREKLTELVNLNKIKSEKRIWAIVCKNDSVLIGLCGLIKNNENENELAFRLREQFWGKGYGSEIAKGLINYGFEILKFDLITADATITNLKSVKILEKFLIFDNEFVNQKDNCMDRRYKLNRNEWLPGN